MGNKIVKQLAEVDTIVSLDKAREIPHFVELTLQQMGYANEKIVRYTLLIEEAVLLWGDAFSEGTQVNLRRTGHGSDVLITIEVQGEKVSPFVIDKSPQNEVPFKKMTDRLLSGVGSELKYKYLKGRGGKQGVNRITLLLPTDNVDEVLYRRTLWVLMIPVVLQCLAENLATVADTLMMGFVDETSMAAVSLATEYNIIHMLMIGAILAAESLVIAQLWGDRQRNSIRIVLRGALALAVTVSLFFFGMAEFLPEKIMSFYTDVPEIISAGTVYLRVIAFSYLIIPFYQTFTCFMRITGAVKLAMMSAIIGCIVNFILNWLLIFGRWGMPALGVLGAGIATVGSCFVQLVIVFFIRRNTYRNFWVFDEEEQEKQAYGKLLRLLYSKAGAVAMGYAVFLVGQNVVVSAFGHMGTEVAVANALIVTMGEFFMSVKIGIGSAAGILIGAKLGGGRMEEAWQSVATSYSLAAKTGIAVMALFVLTGYLIQYTPIVLSDTSLTYFYFLLAVCCINYFFGFMNAISNNGCLYAGGQIMPVFFIDLFVTACILVPLSMAGRFTNLIPIFPLLALLRLDELYSAPLKYMMVRKKKWLHKIN